MAEIVLIMFAAIAFSCLSMGQAMTDKKVKSAKEFKVGDSLYRCEKIRELTELEK